MPLDLAPRSGAQSTVAPARPVATSPIPATPGPETPGPETPAQVARFPRLRYMGSKYKLVPALNEVFHEIGGTRALDAFSGSGVVSYLLKARGFEVTSNDFLTFPTVIARATVANSTTTLGDDLVETICGPAADDRDFIQQKFDGIFLSAADRRFLDSAWSHIDRLDGFQRDVAISALVLSAARKQPRGVFTFTGTRYDDGRRDLHLSMADHFRERVADYNATVFDNGRSSRAVTGDVADLPADEYDIVYLDPPYAPPRDDADYMKRYHFLEGLSVYWRGQVIMEETKTKKIAKKFTPFAYKRTIDDALARTFDQFRDSGAIVLSYSSNAVPGRERIAELLGQVKKHVEVREFTHTYSFGTHATATRTAVSEYVFIGRD
ncbi:DNA adenine methylase [Agromyces atrinae]|uniref:site-specific DNA-methyltransferase (adenine-specific) n=2 Tax=Agromyces atrinae TaxID=592376 RepID=A0A852SG22_9MICO|nr:DNA adenine methylase [Agromyces atrinae]NYD67920.1 DNA adenine methylase/adenine-specific DNA-methyltransferase [Agromyces atrinae]